MGTKKFRPVFAALALVGPMLLLQAGPALAANVTCTVNGTPVTVASGGTINGTTANDRIDCSSGGNVTINAESGNDVIIGGPGVQTVFGGSGNDTFFGGNGADVFDGGSGNDCFLDLSNNDTFTQDTGFTPRNCFLEEG